MLFHEVQYEYYVFLWVNLSYIISMFYHNACERRLAIFDTFILL